MRKNTLFTGSAVAIITPFNQDGIDFEQFERLIEFQISSGTQCIVVCGTTGEPATMTEDERVSVIKFCIEKVNKRVPVVVGTGSNCTATAVKNSVQAQELGADGLLVVTPYYNKCTVKGLVAHYKAISDAVSLPIIAYSVPGRTGVNITASAMLELAKIENVCAIKEASGNIDQITDICATCSEYIDVYSGDDGIVVPMMSIGAKGVISVAANIAPADMQSMCEAALNGDFATEGSMQKRIYPLVKALFCEVNPIPVKTAASFMGYCNGELRLPLTAMSESNALRLKEEMIKFGIAL